MRSKPPFQLAAASWVGSARAWAGACSADTAQAAQISAVPVKTALTSRGADSPTVRILLLGIAMFIAVPLLSVSKPV
jgi:hypothetical protein